VPAGWRSISATVSPSDPALTADQRLRWRATARA
jgi:hypothetical protein